MRLDDQRRSSNIEDERGGGGGFGLPIIGGGIGSLVLIVLALIFGINPRSLFNGGGTTAQAPSQQQSPYAQPGSAPRDPDADFVAAVLGDTEDVWHAYFRQNLGRDYVEPHLVLFSGYVQSACGTAQSATGPFYCPPDQRVYLDTTFFRELRDRFHSPGDFAEAYVIAHEVGHHVQNLLGISDKAHAAEENAGSRREANSVSVRVELQADCFAGVWGHNADKMKHILDSGDLEEALNAASAIGDDRLQRQSRGSIAPDSFTHGTSAQRVEWFRRGFDSGDINDCDTFARGAVR